MKICKIIKIINKIKNKKIKFVGTDDTVSHEKNKRFTDEIREITYPELLDIIKQETDIEIVDIRSPQEFREKRIRRAINIPLYELRSNAESVLKDKNKLIILYCGCGIRSKKAYKILQKMGYTNLYSLKDGIENVD